MAAVVDLNGIQAQIISIMEAANTTTASPVYLSNNMTAKVAKVLSVNPKMIPPQASFFPYVTSFIPEKIIKSEDMAATQLSTKRRATIPIDIIGCTWNNNFVTDTIDPSTKDIQYLMENIELVLRGNYNLNAYVNWQKPTGIKYYDQTLDEQTHLRAGVLSLNAEVFY